MVAQLHREALRKKINELKGRTPGLAVILVGDDPASSVYVRNKAKACEDVGMKSWVHQLPASTEASALREWVDRLNKDPAVDGILVQLPLPHHLNSAEVTEWISPAKDVDGLTLANQGKLLARRAEVLPCTPSGVMALLQHYKIQVAGKSAVVVGRSQIVGQPMALLLQNADATVTVCHSKTLNIAEHTARADIVVVAAGQPRLLGKSDFKKGAVVVDVGIHRQASGKLCGDVRFEELEDWASHATPVPGGVGPMTIAMLLENTWTCFKREL
jgi:methylenetetrahydrofolate dehydrogenase (NADP+)/methenyltetrahydrofolate cyclohydrolase